MPHCHAAEFDDVLDFVATGGYALSHYEQFHRLVRGIDGLWRIIAPKSRKDGG